MRKFVVVVLSMTLSSAVFAATTASDSAADSAYDSGWTGGSNGGSGFGAWQLTVGGNGGHFIGSSAGNAGGSGGIDTSNESWGIWSTNGVTEAIRPFTGTLTAGQVFRVSFDNGWLVSARSVGMALQNAAGDTLWEFFFSGDDGHYTVNDSYGVRNAPIQFTGDGLVVEFELLDASNCLARATDSAGKQHDFLGRLTAQADQEVARIRFWNWEAGSGPNYDLFINSLSIADDGITRYDAPTLPYAVVDTGTESCFDDSTTITAPSPGGAFSGQDAQYDGFQPRFTLSADGLTVYDNNTGLTWQRSPDIDDDGDIDVDDKLTWAELQTYPAALNSGNFGGYSDWRLPAIKEQYSLIDFRGTDPNIEGDDTTGLTPFIDSDYFEFAYGDTANGERVIDSQYASSNLYVSTVDEQLLFGVNFADGRIKGYGLTAPGGGDKTFFVMCCRGNPKYGRNEFTDNGEGTVSDLATGLTWQQADSVAGMNWEDALAYAGNLKLGGYQDWRLPNVKELQSILDYTRSPDTSSSAAIDPIFTASPITNMNGVTDYAFYWSGTTHLGFDGNAARGCYVSFGRGLGTYDQGVTIQDVHGAGCQRSDPKDGDPADYPNSGNGPQGDVSRVFNHVRCVRGGATEPQTDTDGDGLTDWYEYNYVTNTTAMTADGDIDGDGYANINECGAKTSPLDDTSYLGVTGADDGSTGFVVQWLSEPGTAYSLTRSEDLLNDSFSTSVAAGIAATPPVNVYTDTTVMASSGALYYRVEVE